MEFDPVPSKEFVDRLKAHDPSLKLNWDRVQKVWSIWCRDPLSGSYDHVMSVVEPDGTYRPLDDRVFGLLKMNRYYAQNPDILEKIICDDPLEERAKQEAKVHSEMQYISKDKALQRNFESAREMARSVSWKDWMKPKIIRGKDGKILRTSDGKAIRYKPHDSLFSNGGRK